MRWECKYLLCVLVFLFKSNNNPKMCTSLPGFEPGIFWSVVRRVIRCATSPVLETAIFPVHKRLYVSDLLFQWREIWMEYMTWWRFDRVVKPKQLQSLCIVHGTAAVGSFWRPCDTLWCDVGYCNVLCTRFGLFIDSKKGVDVSLGLFCSRSFDSESVTVWHCAQCFAKQTYKETARQSINRPKFDISMYICMYVVYACHLMSPYFSPVQRISR